MKLRPQLTARAAIATLVLFAAPCMSQNRPEVEISGIIGYRGGGAVLYDIGTKETVNRRFPHLGLAAAFPVNKLIAFTHQISFDRQTVKYQLEDPAKRLDLTGIKDRIKILENTICVEVGVPGEPRAAVYTGLRAMNILGQKREDSKSRGYRAAELKNFNLAPCVGAKVEIRRNLKAFLQVSKGLNAISKEAVFPELPDAKMKYFSIELGIRLVLRKMAYFPHYDGLEYHRTGVEEERKEFIN